MNIQRHHTYAAQALQRILKAEGLPVLPLEQLERDFEGTLAQLQQHADHHEQHAGLIDVLRRLGHWKG